MLRQGEEESAGWGRFQNQSHPLDGARNKLTAPGTNCNHLKMPRVPQGSNPGFKAVRDQPR